MPIYDFECGRCEQRFEELVEAGEQPACPACGAPDARRLWSQISEYKPIGKKGLEARRSNDTRRVREEQRRERIATTRERRAQGAPEPPRRAL